MKTLILSSSLSQNSRSYLLCKSAKEKLISKGADCTLFDARNIPLNPVHNKMSDEAITLAKHIKEADNIIIGMAVYNYSINDSLKVLLDTSFGEATGKFFGILCAAGGERSYLATMHLTQICMNQWRMIQLPRVIYATGKDFSENSISSSDLKERLNLFADEFYTIGNKLIS